jgi:hypothetical protein
MHSTWKEKEGPQEHVTVMRNATTSNRWMQSPSNSILNPRFLNIAKVKILKIVKVKIPIFLEKMVQHIVTSSAGCSIEQCL